MPYPYTWVDASGNIVNSYATVADVQNYFATYDLSGANTEHLGIDAVQAYLAEATAQVDAVMLKSGYVVPPPAGVMILPILKQTVAVGAASQLEYARFEAGDESIGKHANGLRNAFDAQLGIFERRDLIATQLGMVDAGWAVQPDETRYFHSGNLNPDSDGNPKGPQFSMGMVF